MMKVSRLADYAVVVLVALSRSEDGLMSASDIAGKTGLPEPTVAKVLKLLAKDGIVTSIRGATGGYSLDADIEQISIAKIVKAVDGPIALTACVEGSMGSCDYEGCCAVKGRWSPVNAALHKALDDVSLADMI